MTDEQKSTKKEFLSCCEGMDFAEMMQKMMDQESGCCDFDCSEMMARNFFRARCILTLTFETLMSNISAISLWLKAMMSERMRTER